MEITKEILESILDAYSYEIVFLNSPIYDDNFRIISSSSIYKFYFKLNKLFNFGHYKLLIIILLRST